MTSSLCTMQAPLHIESPSALQSRGARTPTSQLASLLADALKDAENLKQELTAIKKRAVDAERRYHAFFNVPGSKSTQVETSRIVQECKKRALDDCDDENIQRRTLPHAWKPQPPNRFLQSVEMRTSCARAAFQSCVTEGGDGQHALSSIPPPGGSIFPAPHRSMAPPDRPIYRSSPRYLSNHSQCSFPSVLLPYPTPNGNGTSVPVLPREGSLDRSCGCSDTVPGQPPHKILKSRDERTARATQTSIQDARSSNYWDRLVGEEGSDGSPVSKRPCSLDNVRFRKRTKDAYRNTPASRESRLPSHARIRRPSRCIGNGDLWVPPDSAGKDDVFRMGNQLADSDNRYRRHFKSNSLPLPLHICTSTFFRTHSAGTLNVLPANELDLTGYIDRGPLITTGGFGHVYQGKWKNIGHLPEGDRARLPAVVVKVINLPVFEDERQRARRLKKLKRELELWSTINHDNILPLVGIAHIDGNSNPPAFVSPWMQDGNVIDFLNRNPFFPVVQLLRDIIKGLHYLHTFDPEIVHGDLKAANILVNHRREACLCDFGLSRFAIENTLWNTDAAQASGTLRWMAPELLQADETVPTRPSDVYAYGMTCYEILSGKTPFESVRNDCAVMAKVIKGDRPDRTDQCQSDDIWSLIVRCWAQDPNDRPPTDQVLLIMQDIASSA